MDKQLQHIVRYVNSKGIKIVYVDGYGSGFNHDTPDTIFIDRYTRHGLAASILHEYYHSQQFKRRIIGYTSSKKVKYKANVEFRCELFVIRCCKRLGIPYDTAFIEHCWRDRPEHLLDESGYYVLAYRLLVKNGLLDIDYKE